MSITPVGQTPSSLLAAIELQYAIAAKTLKTADANAQAVLKLLAGAVAVSQELSDGAGSHQPGAQIDELA